MALEYYREEVEEEVRAWCPVLTPVKFNLLDVLVGCGGDICRVFF